MEKHEAKVMEYTRKNLNLMSKEDQKKYIDNMLLSHFPVDDKPIIERIKAGEFDSVITREKIFDDKDKRKYKFKITTIKDNQKKYYHISKKERD